MIDRRLKHLLSDLTACEELRNSLFCPDKERIGIRSIVIQRKDFARLLCRMSPGVSDRKVCIVSDFVQTVAALFRSEAAHVAQKSVNEFFLADRSVLQPDLEHAGEGACAIEHLLDIFEFQLHLFRDQPFRCVT